MLWTPVVPSDETEIGGQAYTRSSRSLQFGKLGKRTDVMAGGGIFSKVEGFIFGVKGKCIGAVGN